MIKIKSHEKKLIKEKLFLITEEELVINFLKWKTIEAIKFPKELMKKLYTM